MTSKKRTIAILLTAVLALSLLLTACGNGGDTPTGDNSTPGTSSTPGVTDTQTPTPDNTIKPDNTPGASDPIPNASETPSDEKQYGMPTWADPSNYDADKKANIDNAIAYQFGSDIDVDKLISEVIEEYGEYIDEHITPEAVRMATILGREEAIQNQNYKSVTGLPESSYIKANDYLKSIDKEPLNGFELADPSKPDEQTAKNSIAALAIAASIYYESNRNGYDDPLWDLGKAFDDAFAYTGNLGVIGGVIVNQYYVLP